MQALSVQSLAGRLLEMAASARNGRAAETVHGGHDKALRQTVLALTAGSALGEHAAPGQATLLVLRGAVRVVTPTATCEGHEGDLIDIPPERHSLEAIEDAAVLLTVATC